jgi:hypothetical protein
MKEDNGWIEIAPGIRVSRSITRKIHTAVVTHKRAKRRLRKLKRRQRRSAGPCVPTQLQS